MWELKIHVILYLIQIYCLTKYRVENAENSIFETLDFKIFWGSIPQTPLEAHAFGAHSTLVPRVFVPLDQRSWNERPWKDPIWSPEIADFRLSCACPAFKWMTNELLGILLPAICIVFQTNQYRSCNGTFESRSFRQACAVRNEDSRYEIEPDRQWPQNDHRIVAHD